MSRVKIGRNDQCWCGSGKKYKYCHLRRGSEEPVPAGSILHHFREEFRKQRCLHPNASSNNCGKVITAHTIQRAGALSRIVDDQNHVLTFYPFHYDERGNLILRRVGWRQASTFSGFCDRHDDATFAPIEKNSFIGNPAQCFLIAYRALCHELYQKAASARAQPYLRDTVDRGMPERAQYLVQTHQALFQAGVESGLESALHWKNLADESLLTEDYSAWSNCTIIFKGDLDIVSTGAPTPEWDVNNRRLQDLNDPTVRTEPLFYGTVTKNDLHAFVFCWPNDTMTGGRFVDSLLEKPTDEIPTLLVEFMFAHVENTYFASKWWEELGEPSKRWIRNLAAIVTPPEETPLGYSKARLVNWEIAEITMAR